METTTEQTTGTALAGHTPGPWRATTTHGIDDSEPFQVWCDDIGAAVAHVYRRSECRDGRGLGEQAANAALIAAAPELLAALEECEMVLTKNIDWQNATNPMARYANGNAGIIKVRDHARAAIAKATPAR